MVGSWLVGVWSDRRGRTASVWAGNPEKQTRGEMLENDWRRRTNWRQEGDGVRVLGARGLHV